MPSPEDPPLGKYFVSGYTAGDEDFPIVMVEKTAYGSRGYEEPVMLSACPEPAYSTHKLVEVVPARTDKRVLWVYEILPGPWVPSSRQDADGGIILINTRKNVAANITPSETTATGTWTRVTKDGKGAFVANEVVETRALPGPLLSGQNYDPRLGLKIGFTEQLTDADVALGDDLTDIAPISSAKQQVKVWDAPTAQLDAYHIAFPGLAGSLNLPDVLKSVTITYNSAAGGGSYTETGTGASTGTSAALSLSLRARGQGSASTMPDIQVEIEQVWSANVPTQHHIFYLPDDGMTIADIKTKINTLLGLSGGDVVKEWPVFKPVAHTVTLQGQQASLSADANAQQHVSISPSNESVTTGEGSGYSSELSVTIRTVRIPPTIHDAITFTVGAGDESVDAEATAGVSGPSSGTNWAAMSKSITPTPITVNSTVAPTSFAATDGTYVIPTTGLYIKDVNISPFQWGYSMVHVELFDFASLA